MNNISWDDIYQQLYPSLYSSVLNYVRHAQDAEDIVQTAFMRVWNNLDRGGCIRSFKDYLYRTTHHLAIDCIHQRQRTPYDDTCEEHLEKLTTVPDFFEDLADREERSRLLEKVEAAWATLTPCSQEALSLYYYPRLKDKNAIPTETNQIGSRARHGVRTLKRKLHVI